MTSFNLNITLKHLLIHSVQITLKKLTTLPNGQNALDIYEHEDSLEDLVDHGSSVEPGMSSSTGKRTRRQVNQNGFVNSAQAQISSDDKESADQSMVKRRRVGNRNSTATSTRRSSRVSNSRAIVDDEDDEDVSESDSSPPKRPTRTSARVARSRSNKIKLRVTATSRALEENDEDELAGEGPAESDESEAFYDKPKNKKRKSLKSGVRGRPRKQQDDDSSSSSPELPTRVSGRGNKGAKSYRERDVDEDLYADEVEQKNAPKIISIREVFQQLPKSDRFRSIHDPNCDTCSGTGKNSNKGPSELIYCQGCSTSIHKICLGYRSAREHMVTKIGHENFVMQCRRCIGLAIKKDSSAPRLDICSTCEEPGEACAAFSPKKTSKQEEKIRQENGGDDPITEVSDSLVNNHDNVLFRCRSCQRAYHFEHLPPLTEDSVTPDDEAELWDERFNEYSSRWECKECCDMPGRVQSLVAWRPKDRESYEEGHDFDMFREDEKEYLVKWENQSYFKCSWMPGAWIWGVTVVSMRKAFLRRDEGANAFPKWTEEEAIPEEYLSMEIIFDVSYNTNFKPRSEKYDKAHINEVEEVLVKFRGLTYDEAVWEDPPQPEDSDRWSEFVAAYNEYVAGQYFKHVPAATMKERIADFRALNFEEEVEVKTQPSSLVGGEMMQYQKEGLNWLLYNFHQKKNGKLLLLRPTIIMWILAYVHTSTSTLLNPT